MDAGSPARGVDENALRERAARSGQGHVFRFWDELRAPERRALLGQLARVDFALLERLVRGESSAPAARAAEGLAPAEIIPLPRTEAEARRAAEAREAGEDRLRRGKVAAFVVAGGQGSRLGFDGPKGAFPIGPVSGRTLFQVHAEKIRALSRRYGATIPWYVMTSESNREATVEHFRRQLFAAAGAPVKEEDVFFLEQDMLPAVDAAGRILLEEKHRLFTSPNGHGGSLKALHDSGALADMRARGVETIFYFQVDNPLLVLCDPLFVGHHALRGAEMSSKVLRKAHPREKVGVIGLRGGKLTVVEYSDLPDEDATAVLADGSLKYWAGSIAIHALEVAFVERLNKGGFALPYHRAAKEVPFIDAQGRRCVPAEKNGIKLETFIFDALGEARRSVTLEVRREDEFSPVKNAAGEDSVVTARRDLTAMYLRWLEAAGAAIERGPRGEFQGHVEISPLTALEAADLAGKIPSGTVVRDGFCM